MTRWNNAISGGSTRDIKTQDTTVNPATLANRTSIPAADTSWLCSPMLNPITSNTINSAMITTVKICSPIDPFNWPSAASTLATMPRLVIESTPAKASASMKLRWSPKSKMTSVVTSSEIPNEKITERTAARK